MERKLLVKVVLVSAMSVVLTLLVIVGVAWAADIFTVDKDGTVRMKVTDTAVVVPIGNLGIGTASPTQKVDVAIDSVGDGLYIRSTGTNSPGIRFENGDLTQVGAVGLALMGGHWSPDASNGDIIVRSKNGKVILATGAGPLARITADNSGNIGIGTTTPATSAKLDITSTTGAILISRMTTAQRDALTAANGMIIYNTTTNAFNFYENGAWGTK